MERSVKGTQSIARATEVLRQLATAPSRGLRLVDVAFALELERPTAHRILQSLVSERLVEQDPRTRMYRLGPLLVELSMGVRVAQPWAASEFAPIRELARLTGDTCFLIKRSGLDAVCIAREEGYYPIKAMVLQVGQRRAMGIGAASVAMLSAMPPEEARKLLTRNQARLVKQGEVRGPELLGLVERARERGYSLCPSAQLPQILSMGMALPHEPDAPSWGISVSTLEQRLLQRESEVAGLLTRVRDEMARLGLTRRPKAR